MGMLVRLLLLLLERQASNRSKGPGDKGRGKILDG